MDKQHADQTSLTKLEVMTDPATVSIADAPIDDEPVSEEEERAVAASKEWFKHNAGTPFEDVVAELGFATNPPCRPFTLSTAGNNPRAL